MTDLAPWADSLSKGVAAIVIALYACGFLIVSLHHSGYGFVGTNPFRPRILAAGAWFLFFSAIPVTAAMSYRELSWPKIAQNLFFLWSFCYGLSFPLSWLLFNFQYVSSTDVHSNWWYITAIILAFVLLFGVIKWEKAPQSLKAFASVVLAIFPVQLSLRSMLAHNFQYDSVTLWFFGVFAVTILELKMRSKRNFAEAGEWAKPLGTMFIVLLVFAQYYYPHLKASWGGGSPVSVTVYFTKESAIYPSRAVPAQLVEESDEGLYIVGPKESRAIYVPRSAVALVYFSDKVADSLLLRENK